jgi:hypothetical protein
MAVYAASGMLYLGSLFASGSGRGWLATAIGTAGLVAWITAVNLLYLLTQIVMAADDCGLASAMRRVAAFLRRERRIVTVVFVVILALVVFATGVSILAAGALSLISFVPLVGFAVLPLQLVAWLLRGIVFQYIGLSSVGAYAKLYRESSAAVPAISADAAPFRLGVQPGSST